jgi:hypothetical protein
MSMSWTTWFRNLLSSKGFEMFRWVKRLFGTPGSYEELTVQNIYVAIVLSGGPASKSDGHIGPEALGVPENKLTDFIVKRFYLHETLLFVAFSLAETGVRNGGQRSKPLTSEMAKKLQSEWGSREGEIPTFEEIGRRCFDMVEALTNDPFAWGREWLREFSVNGDPAEELVARWAGQCLRDQATLQRLATDYVR